MKTAGITEEQYNRYMVSFLVVLVVEPTVLTHASSMLLVHHPGYVMISLLTVITY